ncbi:transcription repressor OFP15-like [Typha angustifolia]|uniref:transcription repressor OFP15-like n=1 Tax=Typha angustifolia TaxID=59011 RepID=UPI003C2B5491
MSSARKRFALRHPVVVDIGCSCRRPRLPSFLTSLQKPKSLRTHIPFSSPSTTTTTSTTTAATTAFSSSSSSSMPFESPSRVRTTKKSATRAKPAQRKAEGGVAIVKESADPYFDFRDSMLQMIVEMEMYAWEDLRGLLHRFLALNSPCHHHLILRAFAEICAGVFSPSA